MIEYVAAECGRQAFKIFLIAIVIAACIGAAITYFVLK